MSSEQSVIRRCGNWGRQPGLSTRQRIGRSIVSNVVLGVSLALSVRAGVASVSYAATDCMAPQVPRGSRVLVYKLDASYEAGDIIVFRRDGKQTLGRVISQDDASGKVTIVSACKVSEEIALNRVVGRVVLNTR